MDIKQCLQMYQDKGVNHFRLVWSGIAYDIRIDDSKFSLLSWDITMRRESPMGTMEDHAIRDSCLLAVLESSNEWEIV